MKRFLLATLLALAALEMTCADAAAEFRIGFEFTIGHCPPYSPKYLAKWGCPDCAYGYGGAVDAVPDYPSYDSGYGHAYYGAPSYSGYAAVPAPSAAPVQNMAGHFPAATVQPAGYYQAPSYWYGR